MAKKKVVGTPYKVFISYSELDSEGNTLGKQIIKIVNSIHVSSVKPPVYQISASC